MESKTLGIFLMVLGGIFLGIAIITMWTMFIAWETWKGAYIILSVPLSVFSVFIIFFGLFLTVGERLNTKLKGIVLIINGIVPIVISFFTFVDIRLITFDLVRFIVLFPLILVGIFFIIYGSFLISANWYFNTIKTRKKANQILGAISSLLGAVNIVFFGVLMTLEIDHPIFFSIAWLILGIVLIIFGGHLIIKKIEEKELNK